MNKKFNLSEKRFINIPRYGLTSEFLPVKDVKEFIKILKEGNRSMKTDLLIDKLAGDGLK